MKPLLSSDITMVSRCTVSWFVKGHLPMFSDYTIYRSANTECKVKWSGIQIDKYMVVWTNIDVSKHRQTNIMKCETIGRITKIKKLTYVCQLTTVGQIDIRKPCYKCLQVENNDDVFANKIAQHCFNGCSAENRV